MTPRARRSVAPLLALTAAWVAAAPCLAAPLHAPVGAGDLALGVVVPEGWTHAPPPHLEVGDVPGAAVTYARAWRAPGSPARLRIACVAAPGGDSEPDSEARVIARMNAVARAVLAQNASVIAWRDDALASDGGYVSQPFHAAATGDSGSELTVTGRHLVAWAGAPVHGVGCTLACVEPAAGAACAPTVASATFTGHFSPPVVHPLAGRVAARLAQRPLATAGLLIGCALTLVGAVMSAMAALASRRRAARDARG